MQKKILVAAVAGALASPLAFAQSSVTIYGAFDMSMQNARWSAGDGGTNASPSNSVSKWDVYNQSSRIGFRGEENLGGGLRAWFQAENNIAADGRQNNPASFAWGNRNTGTGLTGGWGTVMLGNWDSPYKVSVIGTTGMASVGGWAGHNATGIGNGDTTGSNPNANCGNITGTPAVTFTTPAAGTTVIIPAGAGICGQVEGGAASFHRRLSNTMQYWSPKFGGFDFRVAVTGNEEKARNTTTFNNNPHLWAASGTYAAGPWYATVAYEQHKAFRDATTTNANVKDKGWMFGLGYNFGVVALNGGYENLKFGNTATTGGSDTGFKRRTWFIGLSAPLGPSGSALRAGYSNVELRGCGGGIAFTATGGGCSNAGSKIFTLGYEYALSKRSALYANWGTVRNEASSTNVFATPATGPDGVTGTGHTSGTDIRTLAVGIKHTF
jgi:predicted porin